LAITGKGEEVYESCRVSALDLQTEVLSVLSDEEIETFLKLLEKVTNAASVAAEESRQ
jgi:DNA-binding MarR family transcriptional regulator